MLGGETDGHPWSEEVTLHAENRKHPAGHWFLPKFDITDELYQFKNWKRDGVTTILSLDPSNAARIKKGAHPDEPDKAFFERGTRADKDYVVSWTKDFGQGRVFYTALGQMDDVWHNEKYQQHVFGGIKWALGLAPSDLRTQGK
jgi:type 1 glutamine amidotransferase